MYSTKHAGFTISNLFNNQTNISIFIALQVVQNIAISRYNILFANLSDPRIVKIIPFVRFAISSCSCVVALISSTNMVGYLKM